MGDKVTLSELARRTGFNKGHVHRLKSRGVLVFDEHGLIDTDVAHAAVLAAQDPAKAYVADQLSKAQRTAAGRPAEVPGWAALGQPPSAPSPPSPADGAALSYSQAKAQREQAEAALKGLELRKRSRELVAAEAVGKATFEAFRTLRDRVLAVPSLCSGRLAGQQDTRTIERVITDELNRALTGFEDQARRTIAEKFEPA